MAEFSHAGWVKTHRQIRVGAGYSKPALFTTATNNPKAAIVHTTKRFLLLTSCVWCIAFAQTTRADFFGLEVLDRSDDLSICQDPSEPEIPHKLDVCEIHVVLDDPADRLISVAFSNVSTTAQQGFFQHALNFTNTAPACGAIALEPTLVCDSFITLGLECDTGGSSVDPDFDSTGFNTSGEVSGGWYNSAPSNGQGEPDANGRVMISRFSYKQNKTSNGDVCIFVKLAGAQETIAFLLEPFDCSVPGMQPGTGSGSGGSCPAGTTLFVDVDGDPANGCSTWGDACPDLQKALDLAVDGDQIWVAEGTYKPTKPVGGRAETFALANCLKIYGGFFGNEMNLTERDWLLHETILSGDLDGDDAAVSCMSNSPDCDDFGQLCVAGSCITPEFNSENSYHVVVAYDVDTTAILDGFTVSGGRADGLGQGPVRESKNQGSGVNIHGDVNTGTPSTPKLVNCKFRGNWSDDHGAVNDHGGATLTDCVFRENHAASRAGGLYVHSDIGTMVTGCEFYDNTAVTDGGGAYVTATTSGPEPTFQDCAFSGNQANKGGGFYNGANRSPSLSRCTFSANIVTILSGPDPEGAAIYTDVGSPTISDCTFSGNVVEYAVDSKGGAIYIKGASDPLIEGCTFVGNDGGACGGAVYMGQDSTPKIRDCKFIANSAATPFSLYGGAIYSVGARAEVVNCVFQDGLSRYGAAIFQLADPSPAVQPSMDVINCIFINNETTDVGSAGVTGGGGVWGNGGGSLQLANCLFVGNRATSAASIACGGAAGVNGGAELTMTNCTFVANWADTDGGGVFIGTIPDPDNALHNCVFWNNTDNDGNNDDESAQISFEVTAPTATYSDLMNLVQDGPFCDLCGSPTPVCCNSGIANGNIDGDPKFVAALTGTWTANGVYDPATSQSTFTDTPPMWDVDEHVGKFLNVNTTQERVALIAANTDSTITVWGDLRAVGGDTDPYRIDDYSLQSGTLPEDPPSPCIDAADNNVAESCNLDLDGKERFVDDPNVDPNPGLGSPEHPLDIADMGAYEFAGLPLPDCNGNAMDDDCEIAADPSLDCTLNGIPDECDIASGTSLDCNDNGVPDSCCQEDFNGDEIVNAFDLAALLGAWGPCPVPCSPGTDCSCRTDFDADCTVGASDLAILLGKWGSCE